MFFNVIDENENFVVINKKPGISFNNEHNQSGLFNLLKQNYPEIYAIHRLDKVTSGLIVLARNKETARILNTEFSLRNISKLYLAISAKKPKKKQGLIKGDMERSRDKTWKLKPTNINPAITQFFSYSIAEGIRFFLIKPKTGKTHQIRVALKSLGSPILGDEVYGGGGSDRVYLHSYYLKFKLYDNEYSYEYYPDFGKFFIDENYSNKIIETLKQKDQLDWPKI